jgi:putative hydrolase of the HAD superfamily
MIKAVAFDLWETLITDTPELSGQQKELRLQKMESILRDAGFAPTAERIEAAHRSSWKRCNELYWVNDRDIPCRTQVEHFLEDLGLPIEGMPMEALEEAYARAAVEILPETVAAAPDVVAELKEKGFSIGLISNTGRTPGYALREILDAHGFGRHFDAMVFSNEHGALKPHHSIFETLRASLDVRFDEMVFVGDNIYADVHGAQRCGMRAVHFMPPRRGTAVAPHVDVDFEIIADATITDLRELPPLITAWNAYGDRATSAAAAGGSARTDKP